VVLRCILFAFATNHVCNFRVAEGNVCVNEGDDNGTTCQL